ncbi:hypothetical protein HPO96_34850 [Kribbella sandramycini]|uniref:Transmembrane protein n=1 Tax=Kribbella sandramycini TaxID=60450 RepID=A0A7Y4P330_9ACTN|nr:DUF6069 family protein [Kribbella sandramycini]MBB6570056.1 hypothetical protein [Kribbella sandramycini]NOL45441.1 hypothetical protein [Kribbella sandramycini]
MKTLSSSASVSQRVTRRKDRSRLLVVGATTIAAASWWAVLVPVAGLTLDARQGGVLQHVGAPAIVVSAAVMTFAGWALLAILERRTPAARKVWTTVAIVACVLSLGSPLVGGIGIGAKLGLASFHLLVGAVVIAGLRRTALSTAERCYEGNRAA